MRVMAGITEPDKCRHLLEEGLFYIYTDRVGFLPIVTYDFYY